MKRDKTIHLASTQGFTLLELLVVIIIIGVLAAIAAPSWLAFLNRQRVGAVRSDLVSTLGTIQEDARQKNNYQTVWLDLANDRPAIWYGSQNLADPTSLLSQDLGDSSIPPDTVQLTAFYADFTADPDGDGAWVEANNMTGPCDASDKACFQINYLGYPTNPSTEILPDDAQPYVAEPRVPFKIEISALRSDGTPITSTRQCVIVSNLLGSLKSGTNTDTCDALPLKWTD